MKAYSIIRHTNCFCPFFSCQIDISRVTQVVLGKPPDPI